MDEKYNKLKVFIDLILFKVKYKTIKNMKELYAVYEDVYIEHNPISIRHFKILKKYNLKDIRKFVEFHNKYVKDDKDKIDYKVILGILETVIEKNRSSFPVLDKMKDNIIEHFIKGSYKDL
jgi:hypothetical protein